MTPPAYQPDRTLKGKLRRRAMRLMARRPARRGPDRPLLSVTFDDIPASAAEAGAALLEARGLRGGFYISAGLAGREGPMGRYAEGAAVRDLAARGHEIGCHTFSHLDCGRAGRAAVEADVAANGEALRAWGAPQPATFAYPYGDVAWAAKRALRDRFALLRTVQAGLVRRGGDLAQAPAVGVEGPDGEAVARRWLRRAAAERAWLILFTHDVAETPSPWGCTPAALSRLLDEALGAGFEVVTPAEGARLLGASA